MPDTQSRHRLYLVRHGEAKAKEEAPERGLTDAGRQEVTKMAEWAAAVGIQVDEILHSGKLRAQQTAEIFAEHLRMQAAEASGLAPKDDVKGIAEVISSQQGSIMLVGHLPFLDRLGAKLITGDAEISVATLDAGAVLELTLVKDAWKATCLMQPKLLPSV